MERLTDAGIIAGIVAFFTAVFSVIGKLTFATKNDLQRHEDKCGKEQRRCNDQICKKIDVIVNKVDVVQETVIRLDEKIKFDKPTII